MLSALVIVLAIALVIALTIALAVAPTGARLIALNCFAL
jgi:hypothetical protein